MISSVSERHITVVVVVAVAVAVAVVVVVCIVAGVEGGRYFFSMVREGDQVMFATEDENESTLWVQAIYRATGQSHKPVPPTTQPSRLCNTQLSKEKGGAAVVL